MPIKDAGAADGGFTGHATGLSSLSKVPIILSAVLLRSKVHPGTDPHTRISLIGIHFENSAFHLENIS